MGKIFAIFAAVLFMWSGSANAIQLSRSELPVAYQACTGPGQCPPVLTSAVDIDGMSVFLLNPATDSYLVRYSIFAPTDGALTGHVWLAANGHYDLTESQHAFSLLFDYATPDPRGQWIDQSTTALDFTLTTDALLGGEGHSFTSCCSGGGGPSSLQQSIVVPCAATSCTLALDFNLIGLRYTAEGDSATLSFYDDTRALLYRQHATYDGQDGGVPFDTNYEYYAAPVPVPAAFWLLASGLGVLVRRRRTAHN